MAFDALQKLCKWRGVFAGWQLGTRSKEDPECQAVRDHREVTMIMRAEFNALVALLVEKKIFTVEEFDAQVQVDAALLDKQYEEKFPGISTDEMGVVYDTRRAAETMRNWRP